jgi:hypothetical protein
MKRMAKTLSELATGVNLMTGKIKKWPVMVSITEDYNERSDRQNRTFHMHFGEAAKHFGWTPKYAKRFAKYTYGLPILATRRDKAGAITEDGKYWSDTLERIDSWPYEARIDFMEKIPVTSEMTPAEGALFITTYMQDWQEQGCHLTDPKTIDPDYYTDLEKEMKSRGQA